MPITISTHVSGHPRPLRRFTHTIAHGAIFSALFVSSCATLPDTHRQLRNSSTPALPQMVAANGAMSKSSRSQVVGTMEGDSGRLEVLRRHLAREDAIIGSPLVAGNEVKLYLDGPTTYKAMFAAIAGAKNHIHIETYILDPDAVGQQLLDQLVKKQRQGVQVNLIYDSLGGLQTPDGFFAELRAAGGQVVEFNPVNPLKSWWSWNLNQRTHRKLLIVDGRIAFTGGINFSNVYSKSPFRSGRPPANAASIREHWRDTHIRIRGPVVGAFQKIFIAAWKEQGGPSLAVGRHYPPLAKQGQLFVRAINNSPAHDALTIYPVLLSAFQAAENTIQITVAYFAPDDGIMRALEAAARRGVQVTLLLPSVTDSGLIFHAGRSHYKRLLRAGVHIYERQGALLHAKTVVVDGVWTTIGSANLDWRSFLHNEEVNAIILGPEFGDVMNGIFKQDLAASRRITLEQWRKRPIRYRAREFTARLFEYWL